MGKVLALGKMLKNIRILFSGFLAWSFVYIKNKGDLYRTANEFHRRAQDGDNAFSQLLNHTIADNFKNFSIVKANLDRDSISSAAIAEYSDDSLSGYADENYNKGGNKLQDQQRGLILPVLEKAIVELSQNGKIRIVEIGTGNGDVLAYLAEKYPANEYVGADFSIKTASNKHQNISNLSFIKGYALDLLKEGTLTGDILFAASTFLFFTPKEIENYLSQMRLRRFRQIVINEPTWADYAQTNDSIILSRHLEGATWHHNYCGYLRKAGYEIKDFQFSSYRHPSSPRPDIFVCVARGAAEFPR